MRVRRCAHLMFEPRERMLFDLASLAAGGDGLRAERALVALVPHRQGEATVSAADVALLAELPCASWSDWSALTQRHDESDLQRLLAAGLLVAEDDAVTSDHSRDQRLRNDCWYTPSAAYHFAARWSGVRSGDEAERAGYTTMRELIATFGEPPPPEAPGDLAAARVALPAPVTNAFDALLQRRTTCRNFDTTTSLSLATLATLLHRVFGAQGSLRIDDGAATTVLKRNSPSGGGLHPMGACLLVQRVDGLAPGLYRYGGVEHALTPLRELDAAAAADLAMRSVAAQAYFATAPVLVLLTARFGRSFWKYRNHAKAYRVTLLDAGHLSQTLYLAATDLGLGAFITAAINEVDIEQALALDTPTEGVLAVCGFGHRAARQDEHEFDPGARTWDEHGARIDR